MEEGEERGSPRDLLRWFSGGGLADEQPEDSREDLDEIELSLSLGGFFGTEPSSTKLLRSSSIAAVSELPVDSELTPAAPLARTYSLPAEADEEQRKRKEMQARSNRLEAKRKKLEKTLKWTPPPPPPPPVVKERPVELAAGKRQAEPSSFRKYSSGVVANGASVAPLPGWRAEASGYFRNGSIASLGGSSSRVSDFESGKMKGLVIPGLSRESGSPSVTQPVSIHYAYCKPAITHVAPPVPVHANHKAAITPVMQPVAAHVSHKAAITPVAQPVPAYANHRAAICPVAQPVPAFANQKTASTHPEATHNSVNYGKYENDPLKKSIMGSNSIGQMNKMILEEMPCVSTRVPGPDGRRVEGFLYKYRNGEEVRIVCVCHGSFLTPAEFVKHAGGGEVAYPLKHIVVGPNPSGFWQG